jgi:hypothetical protein
VSVNQDVLNYGLTCKAIFCVFEKSLFVRYKRSLDKQGLRDNPHCDLPLKARWALLRDRTRTWFELDPVDDCDAPPVVGVLDINNVALSPMAFVANFTRSPSDDESGTPDSLAAVFLIKSRIPLVLALKRATVILLPGYCLCKISR